MWTSAGVRKRLRPAVMVSALMAMVGCGDENEPLTPVYGRVIFQGEPLKTGEIQFIPDGPGIKRGGSSPIDEAGNYNLSTYGLGDGAYPGKYKVTITARGADLPIPSKKVGKMMEEDMQGSGKPLISERYFVATSSGLTAEVLPGKSNQVDFELFDGPGVGQGVKKGKK